MHQNRLEDSLKHTKLSPTSRVPDIVVLEWGLRVCTSNKLPGDAAAGSTLHLENQKWASSKPKFFGVLFCLESQLFTIYHHTSSHGKRVQPHSTPASYGALAVSTAACYLNEGLKHPWVFVPGTSLSMDIGF